MRHFALLMGFLLLLSAIHADTSASYTQDGLLIERSMQIRPINSISSTTGALRALNGSVITLSVTNRGPSDRHNLTLEEDLTYLPSYIRITYSIRPSHTDGRKVVWDVGDLPVGRRFEASFSLPTPVSDAAVNAAKPPVVRSARPPAELIAPAIVERGQTVVLRLTTPDGTPIGGAQLELIQPDGTRSSGVTDELGRFVFIADKTGFYTYHLADFSAAAIPATESRVPVLVLPPTTGSITPVVNASNTTGSFSFDALLGLWPLAGGLLIAGMLAFGLYGHFNRSESDDGPTPPAPAYRSASPNADGGISAMSSPSSSASERSAVSTFDRSTASISDRTSASTSASLRPEADARMPPPASPPASSGPSGRPAISSGGPSLSPTAVLSQTRDLLAARRGAKTTGSSSNSFTSSSSSDDGEDKDSDSGRPSYASNSGSKPHYSEETTSVSERFAFSDSDNEEKEERDAPSVVSRWTEETATSDSNETEASGIEGAEASETDGDEASETGEAAETGETEELPKYPKSAGSPPPSWMTQEALSGEQVEVDDEAISKTISELEALRSELKNRANARAAGESQSGFRARAPASRRNLSESLDELDKLGREIDEESTEEAADNSKESQEEVLSNAGEPEASDEEITESISPADVPTVSEAAGAEETNEEEEASASPEQEEARDVSDNSSEETSHDEPTRQEPSDSSEPDEADSSSPPPAPSPRFQIRNSISIAPIPPRMRRSPPTRKEIVKRLAARSKISSSVLRKSVPLSKKASAPLKRGPAKREAGKSKKR